MEKRKYLFVLIFTIIIFSIGLFFGWFAGDIYYQTVEDYNWVICDIWNITQSPFVPNEYYTGLQTPIKFYAETISYSTRPVDIVLHGKILLRGKNFIYEIEKYPVRLKLYRKDIKPQK